MQNIQKTRTTYIHMIVLLHVFLNFQSASNLNLQTFAARPAACTRLTLLKSNDTRPVLSFQNLTDNVGLNKINIHFMKMVFISCAILHRLKNSKTITIYLKTKYFIFENIKYSHMNIFFLFNLCNIAMDRKTLMKKACDEVQVIHTKD